MFRKTTPFHQQDFHHKQGRLLNWGVGAGYQRDETHECRQFNAANMKRVSGTRRYDVRLYEQGDHFCNCLNISLVLQ